MSRAADIAAALRIHQWVKNTLVFVSPLAAHVLFEPGVLLISFTVFLSFCLSASGVYVVNDYLDLPSDREHPRKSARPMASGRLPPTFVAAGPVLMLVGLLLAYSVSLPVALVVAGYIGVSLAYSAWLKTQPLVDVFVLSALYTIRLFAGQVALEIELSIWLLSFSGFLFLSLAFLKRVAEYVAMQSTGAKYDARRGYTASDIAILQMLGIAASNVATLVFAFYVDSAQAASLYATPRVLWLTVPVLLFWQTRMWLSASRGYMTDDPIVFAARDWVSQICFALLVVSYLLAVAI